MTRTRPAGTLAMMDAFVEGVPTLEVRWILPGQMDAAVAGWLSASPPEVESREDVYLLSPDVGGLSVKVRGGRALEVKMFLGSPGILDLPGRACGRMQYWQKWSFPFRPGGQGGAVPDGWRRVGKQRRTSRFALSTGARCAAEVAGLTSAGIPQDQAVAAVLIQRLFTAYLPPIWGWLTLTWMRRHEYV